MLVSFLSDNLIKQISFLNHAVSARNQLPILSNFLIEASDGALTISATDLEIGIISSITASVEKEGRVTVPAKNFSDIISNINNQKITLEIKENGLRLRGGRVEATFQTMSAEEFPKIFDKKGDSIMSIDKKDVEELLSRVSFAAAIDAARPSLSGVLLESEKDGVCLVATDSYRLSFQKTNLKTIKELESPIVIPARLAKELQFLKEDEQRIDVFVSKESNQILFFQGKTTLVGRLIDSDYPTYQKIIPTEHNSSAEFNREELLNAIKICSVFARETANIVKISLGKDKVTVSANSPSVGGDTVEIDAKITGEENEIAFNARYLMDILSVLSAETLVFEMTGPLNPGVFKIKDDKNFLHLIMPIRVQE